jgi:hypothetical protein
VVREGWLVSEVDEEPRRNEVRVVLEPAAESSPEDAERLSIRLRRELRELDQSSISIAPSPVSSSPVGAKGADAGSWVTIIVALSSGGVLTSLVGTLRDWLGRQRADHKVSVTIDGDELVLDRATVREQSKLVEAYILRHRRD